MGNTTKSNVKNKPRDLTIVKVGAAFVMMVLSMLAVQRVLEIYAVMNTFDAVYRASQICWKLCAVLCAASAAAYVLLRGKKFRVVFPYVFVLSALVGACALDLRYFWTEHATALYMAHAAVYCLYIIYCLYRSEFFCFSVAAIVSGFCFYFYSKGLGLNARTAVMAAVVVLVLAMVALLANRAAKDKGRICLFGKKHAVFPVRFNPTVLYVACTVLACCLIACLLLGSALFAYYCMFAAIAIELIGAVYYTFQLK